MAITQTIGVGADDRAVEYVINNDETLVNVVKYLKRHRVQYAITPMFIEWEASKGTLDETSDKYVVLHITIGNQVDKTRSEMASVLEHLRVGSI